jgi:hypothetical protein
MFGAAEFAEAERGSAPRPSLGHETVRATWRARRRRARQLRLVSINRLRRDIYVLPPALLDEVRAQLRAFLS